MKLALVLVVLSLAVAGLVFWLVAWSIQEEIAACTKAGGKRVESDMVPITHVIENIYFINWITTYRCELPTEGKK